MLYLKNQTSMVAIVTSYEKEYYKVVDAVIYSSAVVLEFPPSVENTVVPNGI